MIERLTTISDLPVGEIKIGERLRDISPEGVENLTETITANGFVGRVLVRRTKKGDFILDGAHRLTVMRQLGRETIPCDVIKCSDDEALMLEVDGNVSGAGMTDLQIAYFLARRRAAHQRLNPEARQGYAGAAARANEQLTQMSLAKTVAIQRGVTVRHVYRMMAAGDALGPDEYRRLAAAPNPIRQDDLLQIAKIKTSGERYYVIDALAEGKVKKASAARKAYLAERGEGPARKDATDAAYTRMVDAWKRANKVARRRFLEEHGTEVWSLLDEMDKGLSE